MKSIKCKIKYISNSDVIKNNIRIYNDIFRFSFNRYQDKSWFYPDFNKSLNLLNEQWKQTLKDNFIKDWKELFDLIKKSKLKYRFLLKDCLRHSEKVFSHFDKKSLTFLIRFNII